MWININTQLPDADIIVLVYQESASEPVWLGYWDGESWREADGHWIEPTHWMELPEGPIGKGEEHVNGSGYLFGDLSGSGVLPGVRDSIGDGNTDLTV